MSTRVARPQALTLAGPAGRLQAILEDPGDESPRAAAVVCHPHPMGQGTMTNKVTHTLARSLNLLGIPALRFNFRGVGDSDGEHDDGRGETDDALAALDWVQQRWPDTPLWLAGFSFGAYVAIKAAVQRPVRQLVTVAPPAVRMDLSILPQPNCPWLIIQGDADELVDVDAVVDWVDGMEPGPRLVVLPGVDHFFHGKITVLRDCLREELGG